MTQTQEITIKLSKDEALVLSDFLLRFNETENNASIQHKSEQIVLWNIETQLEKVLTDPFLPNYDEIISEARKNVQANY